MKKRKYFYNEAVNALISLNAAIREIKTLRIGKRPPETIRLEAYWLWKNQNGLPDCRHFEITVTEKGFNLVSSDGEEQMFPHYLPGISNFTPPEGELVGLITPDIEKIKRKYLKARAEWGKETCYNVPLKMRLNFFKRWKAEKLDVTKYNTKYSFANPLRITNIYGIMSPF